MTNAGEEAAIIVGKVLENNTDTFGYNTATGEFGDLIALGIVDPVKVVRSALQNISFIASLLITTEAVVAEILMPSMLSGGNEWNGRNGFLSLLITTEVVVAEILMPSMLSGGNEWNGWNGFLSLLITTEIMIAETFQKDALASLIVDGEIVDGEIADGEIADGEIADGEIADGEVNRVDC